MSVAWSTGIQPVFFFCSGVSKLFGARGSLTKSKSPRSSLIHQDVYNDFLFVLDDSFSS